MSFWKAEQLLALATLAASRHQGISLDDVIDRFKVSKRTAQRMLHTLEAQFPDALTFQDDEGRKRWSLPSAPLRDLMTVNAEELAALDLAIEAMRQSGGAFESQELLNLREKILALIPRAKAARLVTDHEALLEAQGLAARPGPRQHIDPKVSAALAEAIKACRIIVVSYLSRTAEDLADRRLAPYGLLTGIRRYLVARPAEDLTGEARLFIIENIADVQVTADSFIRDPIFNLQSFANRAFGIFQNPEEYGEVVWRFSPQAAGRARSFVFHPSQQVEEQPDGTVVVRFWASGHLEMAWHLYQWGAEVEVLAPPALRAYVEPFQRRDFPALP